MVFFFLLLSFFCALFTLLSISPKQQLVLKQLALITTSIVFIISLFFWVGFDYSTAKFQFIFILNWAPMTNLNINPVFGIDGISLLFVLLTTLIFPVCVLASWFSIKTQIKFYFACFLIMELILVLVFSSLDILFFYIFFEAILIPMFFIIGIWGSRERKVRASYLFFLYTLIGSLFMLMGIIFIFRFSGSTSYLILSFADFTPKDQKYLWLLFFASFGVKVPMLPFHIWLPEAHVEAPTAGSVILAGILLKLGSYGFLRFSLKLFPLASFYFSPFFFTLGLFGIVLTSLTAIRQIDLKRLIAYTSVAHMNLVVIGLFTGTIVGIEAALFQSVSHGFVSSALFLLIGCLYDRWGSRLICDFSGLVNTMPIFVTIFFFFSLANLGLPGTSSFVGEFLLFLSIFKVDVASAFFASTSMVLSAAYALWLFNRIAFGNARISGSDLTIREAIIFFPLILGTTILGIKPTICLKIMHATVFEFILENF